MSSTDDAAEARSAAERSSGSRGAGGATVTAGGDDGSTRTPPPRTRRGAPTTRPPADDLRDVAEPEPTSSRSSRSTGSTKSSSTKSSSTKSGAAKRGSTKSSTAKGGSTTSSTRAGSGNGGSSTSAAPGSPLAGADTADPAAPATKPNRGRSSDPTPAARTPAAFDWEDLTTGAGRDATVLAAAGATRATPLEPDPAEPEPTFERSLERPKKAAKRQERRFRQTVQKVDLWSVTKMALCFYVSAMGVVMVSLVALWLVADSAGIIDNVENFIGDLFSSEDFQFVSGEVLRGAVLVTVVIVALMVVFTIIAASFYNIFAELFGGVEVVIREEEQPPKR